MAFPLYTTPSRHELFEPYLASYVYCTCSVVFVNGVDLRWVYRLRVELDLVS